MDIQTVAQWLIDQGYIKMSDKGGYLFNTKFNKDLKDAMKKVTFVAPEQESGTNHILVAESIIPVPERYQFYIYQDWVKFYENFIMACGIPVRLPGKYGNEYSGNKYTEDGMKAFQKALKDGYRYDLLTVAVTLYYKSGIQMKKAIGTYMTSGEWRSDYEELRRNADSGNVQTYIKTTINDGSDTSGGYQIG